MALMAHKAQHFPRKAGDHSTKSNEGLNHLPLRASAGILRFETNGTAVTIERRKESDDNGDGFRTGCS
jgi:hypothetical protein